MVVPSVLQRSADSSIQDTLIQMMYLTDSVGLAANPLGGHRHLYSVPVGGANAP